MKAFKLLVACAATVLFASCLQMEEPASVEALRTAKAELLTAELQYKQAQTAYLNAQTEYQVLLNKIQEVELAKLTAQTDKEIEELLLEHQILLLEKKLALAEAEQVYADALVVLADKAKGISETEQKQLDFYMQKLADIQYEITETQESYEGAVADYLDAQYSFNFDYEVYKSKYLANVNLAKLNVENANEFQTLVGELSSSNYLATIAELETKIKADQKAVDELKNSAEILKHTKKTPLNEEIDALNNQETEIDAKKEYLEDQQDHLYTDNEKFYKVTILVPALLTAELHSFLNNYNTIGFVYNNETYSWTTVNGTVTVQFDFESDDYTNMRDFLSDLNDEYKSYKNGDYTDDVNKARKAYALRTEQYLTEYNALVQSADKEYASLKTQIQELEASKLALAIEKSKLELQLSAVDVEVAAKNKEHADRNAALGYVKKLKETYEGFLTGKEVSYPVIKQNGNEVTLETFDLEDGYYVEYKNKTMGSGVKVDEVLAKWVEHANFCVAAANAEVKKAEDIYNMYCEADNALVFAQKTEIDAYEMLMVTAEAKYNYYKAQFSLYTKLFNEFLAAVTGNSETTTPPADVPAPETPQEGTGAGTGEAA